MVGKAGDRAGGGRGGGTEERMARFMVCFDGGNADSRLGGHTRHLRPSKRSQERSWVPEMVSRKVPKFLGTFLGSWERSLFAGNKVRGRHLIIVLIEGGHAHCHPHPDAILVPVGINGQFISINRWFISTIWIKANDFYL